MANRPTAQTFSNDVSLLWLLKNSKTIYRSILAQAKQDTSTAGLATNGGVEASAASLREIILTEGEIEGMMEALEIELRGELVSQSEYGEFAQTANAAIIANAESITQTNTLAESIKTDQLDFEKTVNGQIIRGFVANPDYPAKSSDPYLYGIVISTQVNTTGASTTGPDNNTYEAIDTQSTPTFGFYTSQGWQFWVGGNRVGWYNSSDGRLHVGMQEVEGNSKMGNWLIEQDSTGFGIKYIGA